MFARVMTRWRERLSDLERDTLALYYAYRDPLTPWLARGWAALVAAYALSPIDLIPDFVPVLGYLDDLVLVPLGIVVAVRLIPATVLADSRAQAREALGSGKPRVWAGAALVLGIWLAVAAWALWALLGALRA